MKITILCVGKIKEKFFVQAVEEYSKRLSRYCKLEILEMPDEKTPEQASEKEELQIKDKEGERLLSKIKDQDYVIALAIERMLSETCLSVSPFVGNAVWNSSGGLPLI